MNSNLEIGESYINNAFKLKLNMNINIRRVKTMEVNWELRFFLFLANMCILYISPKIVEKKRAEIITSF